MKRACHCAVPEACSPKIVDHYLACVSLEANKQTRLQLLLSYGCHQEEATDIPGSAVQLEVQFRCLSVQHWEKYSPG